MNWKRKRKLRLDYKDLKTFFYLNDLQIKRGFRK